ncbi:MAG: hypothetical protein KJN84_06420, partial [Bacteroidia bacterium]|nr:hypothetical protein [Bacteroidia bacterium]
MKSLRIVIILIVATFCSIASIEAQIEDPINKERITNIIKNQLGAPSLPDEVTNSFFNKSKTKEWANLLIDKMSELKDLEDDDPERGKLNRGIDRYSKRIVEEYNDHWNDMVLKNGALPNYNIASTFPGLQKDIESMITSLSKGCQPKAREFIKDPVIKINKWVNEIEKLRSYKNDVDKFVLDSSSEPCDFLIKSKMKSFLANQAAVNRIKKETETFESDLLLKVISLKKCLDEIRKSYYFKNVKKYKNVTFKQIEYLKNEFELIDEWRKENICEEEADAEECRAMLNASKKEYFEFEASLGFNQLGVNKYKIKELINRDGRYACAEDDIKTAFDNLDLSPLENTDYAGKLNAILNSLNNNFSGLNCNKSISNEVESFREVIKGKTLRLDLQKKDLKEEISEIEQWIKDHPCDEKQAEEKEDDCPDKM